MPQTYDYKVRDRSGSLVSGQLVGDSETLVLQRLREMGMTPVEVKKAGTGLKMEINLRPGRVKLKKIAVFCRQFATMVNSGLPILRALSILADQTENKELAKVLVQVADRRRAGVVALGGAGQAPEGVQQPVHLDDQGRRDRRCPRRRPALPGGPDREGGRAAAPDQVGDDLPGGRGRAGHADPLRDAPVRRPAVRDDLRQPRGDAAAADQDPAGRVERVPDVLVRVPARHRRRDLPVPSLQAHGRRAGACGRREDPGARVRPPVPQGRPREVRLHARDAPAGRRPDPAGARQREGDRQQPGHRATPSTTSRAASARASRSPSRWASTRCSRRWWSR